MQTNQVTIAGAGLVGSLLSVYMARRGYKVTVFEKRPDMRKTAISAGRSINLALSDRGLLALEKVGLADAIKAISIPMHGRLIHNTDGSTVFQPYGKEGQSINSVSRGTLNMRLMDLAEQEGVHFSFQHSVESIDWKSMEMRFTLPDGDMQSHYAGILFGADGAFSATRLIHQLHHDKFNYQQYYIDCGYKELTIPAAEHGGFAMERNALHIWPRKDYMLIALPNLDHTFTCTLFFPFEGEKSFAHLTDERAVLEFFNENFPDVIPMMPELTAEFFRNPISTLVTVKCFPWVRGDHFALIGDAAHAIVPFFGQGMNCGFEDCRVLDELIDEHHSDWSIILDTWQRLRKPDSDAIADLAIQNFTEMRERTADPQFLLQKKIEAWLHEKHPEKWIPAYSQVTFSPHIRYSQALHQGQVQETIMQELMQSQPGLETDFRRPDIETWVLNRLNALNA